MLETQQHIQMELGNIMGDSQEEVVRNNVLGIISETTEVLGEVNWKPWKTAMPVDRAAVLAEMIDILQFWMNICNEFNITEEEIYEQFGINVDKVYDRIKSGY